MLQHQDYLNPHYADGALRTRKPIITYLTLITSYKLLGVSSFLPPTLPDLWRSDDRLDIHHVQEAISSKPKRLACCGHIGIELTIHHERPAINARHPAMLFFEHEFVRLH